MVSFQQWQVATESATMWNEVVIIAIIIVLVIVLFFIFRYFKKKRVQQNANAQI